METLRHVSVIPICLNTKEMDRWSLTAGIALVENLKDWFLASRRMVD